MKKVLCILMTVALSVCTLTCIASADEYPAKAEVMFPQRITIANALSLVPSKKLIINNPGENVNETTYPGAKTDPNLKAELEHYTDGHISSRNIHTYDFANKSDVTETDKETLINTNLRFKDAVGSYVDGSYAWKRPFTYEFDFTVTNLDNYFMIKIGKAGVKFVKDTAEDDKFFITWDGEESEPVISGQQLEFGKKYNIRIEADVTAGQGVFAIFTDPETGYANTSYKKHGQTFKEQQYIEDYQRCPVSLECTGRVAILTENENMFYESYFIRAHGLDVNQESNEITANATVLNSIYQARTSVPYLFLCIYDSNGAMVASEGIGEGEVARQTTSYFDKITSTPYSYDVKISVADLPDGEYTARTSMWRDKNISCICDEVIEKSFTVENGAITEVIE